MTEVVTDITAILVSCTDSGWEVVEWYGDEGIADEIFDTKAEAIKVARRIFNDNPSVQTLETATARSFGADRTVIRRRPVLLTNLT
jgi:hypothetical protein|tara:strand:- start:38 stop:295 length:258 start_codon:yes stop_codon:yes gene_type:complete